MTDVNNSIFRFRIWLALPVTVQKSERPHSSLLFPGGTEDQTWESDRNPAYSCLRKISRGIKDNQKITGILNE